MSPSELPAGDEPSSDFLNDYFAECDEHLMGVRRLLLRLEQSIGRGDINTSVLDELFRHFHSLKGISGMVELRPAEELSHRAEDYLRALRRHDVRLSPEGVNALFDATQLFEQVVNARRSGGVIPAIDAAVATIAGLVSARPADLAAPVPGAPAGAPLTPHWRFLFAPSRELVGRGIRVDLIRTRLTALGEIIHAAPHVTDSGMIAFEFIVATGADAETIAALQQDGVTAERLPDASVVSDPAAAVDPEWPAVGEPSPVAGSVAPSHVVRVDLTRLDDLMRNVGDLVISRARLGETLARIESHVPAGEWRAVQENALVIDRQLRTLREAIMRVRLVPIGEIFRRMPFVVRDLARETGKRVRLQLQGQSTEIDKFLIERMMDPVLHLVRNAVSHGIETADERVAAGKRPEATITLSASTAGEIVTLEVADDGRGIDVEAVRSRAAGAGLDPATAGDAAGLLELLCAPGFSTRDESDRASGRGVGMAVVKSTVEELGGVLRMETAAGAGTRFIVELPVTLAITDALIAKVGAETFAAPQAAVREVIAVPLSAIRALEQNEITPYRGGVLPLVRLSRLFGLADAARDTLHVLVVGTGGSALGLAVDRVVGQREIVVRAATDPLVKVAGISGATDLGDGRVVLIIDPAALARQMRGRPAGVVDGIAGGGGR
ncbi:MAG TPA: chemotaxis protein CheA [Vicinamibacterales bacterium]|nr:chemotaxis protein CheA [Vicinamibacterales bacterium]